MVENPSFRCQRLSLVAANEQRQPALTVNIDIHDDRPTRQRRLRNDFSTGKHVAETLPTAAAVHAYEYRRSLK